MDQPTDNAEALELIGIHRARLHELRKQEALFGATADPSIPIQIREIERKIADLQSKASQVVSSFGLPASLMTTGEAAGAMQPVAAAQASPPDLGTAATGLVPAQHVQAAAALAVGRRSGQAMVVSKADNEAGGLGLVPEVDIPAALGRLSDRQREIAEGFGMIVGMVPSPLSVATLAISTETRPAAREHAEQLATACRTIAPGSFAPERWTLMAEAIERAYLQGWSSAQLDEWDQSLTGEKLDSFNLTMRLAACANATPAEAAVAMLAFLPRLCGCFPPGTATHRELIIPFVVAYWTYRFQHERFLFGRAMVVESQLSLAVAAPEEERVVSVMRAIHAGFTFAGPMPDEVRHWVYG